MGRPTKTTEQLKKNGTYQRSKHGDRLEQSYTFAPIGKMPEGLGSAAKKLWNNVIKNMPPGTVSEVDRESLTAACNWWQQWNDIMDEIKQMRPVDDEYYKLLVLAAMAYKHFQTTSAKFGLNPVDRCRLKVADTKKEETTDPFEMLRIIRSG